MTYTTVHKTYEAETFEAAAAAMLRDPDVWRCVDGCTEHPLAAPKVEHGNPKGYSVESWRWNEATHELTVNFR